MFFDVGAGFTPAQTATAVAQFWGTIDNSVNDEYSWQVEQEVRQYNEATGALQAVNPVSGSSGTGLADGQSLDLLQGLIRWTTGDVIGRRAVVGRTFIPGVTEQANDQDGTPTTNYVTDNTTAITALFAALPSSMQVWHRPVNKAGGSQHDVIAGTVMNRWAYLTSRRNF
jgi:hypothetical protein